MSDTVDCPVSFNAGVSKFGTFANAFRVMPESGQECFLDFCVYSVQEERAEVVARIRIHRTFIGIIRERLAVAIHDLTGNDVTEYVVRDGLLRTEDGKLVLFDPSRGGGGDVD